MEEPGLNALDLLMKTGVLSVYAKGTRPALQVEQSFSFVLNIAAIEVGQPIEITSAPGHRLRRATDKEILAIKDVLADRTDARFTAWENGPAVKEGTKLNYPALPKEQWRYFVIAFEQVRLH